MSQTLPSSDAPAAPAAAPVRPRRSVAAIAARTHLYATLRSPMGREPSFRFVVWKTRARGDAPDVAVSQWRCPGAAVRERAPGCESG